MSRWRFYYHGCAVQVVLRIRVIHQHTDGSDITLEQKGGIGLSLRLIVDRYDREIDDGSIADRPAAIGNGVTEYIRKVL